MACERRPEERRHFESLGRRITSEELPLCSANVPDIAIRIEVLNVSYSGEKINLEKNSLYFHSSPLIYVTQT